MRVSETEERAKNSHVRTQNNLEKEQSWMTHFLISELAT